MRAIAAVLALMFTTSAIPLAARADTPTPQPFVATYAVTYRGIGAGSLTFKFSQDPAANGRYVFETSADPSALARLFVSGAALERSVMEIGADGVRPIEWKMDDGKSGGKKDGQLKFDWARNRVSGEVEGEAIDLPTEPGLQDRSSIQISVAVTLLRGAEPGTIPLIDDNRIKRYRYTKKEAVPLDSTIGKVDTMLYESTREGSSRVSRLWLAPSLEFLPVRAEQIRKGKVETVMTLTAFEPGARAVKP